MVGTSIVSGLGLRSTAFLGTTAVSITVPTAPQSFTATAASSSSINLSWAAPASNGGAAITSYTLKRGATTIYTGAGTSFTDTGLSPATGYSYTVLATNSVGDGPTASASATTSAGVPSAPVLSVDSSTPGNPETAAVFNLSWTVPSNNGSAITGYRIETSGDNQTWYLQTTVSSSTTTYTAGADIGQEYGLRVLAVNSVGTGLPSNVQTIFYYE